MIHIMSAGGTRDLSQALDSVVASLVRCELVGHRRRPCLPFLDGRGRHQSRGVIGDRRRFNIWKPTEKSCIDYREGWYGHHCIHTFSIYIIVHTAWH